MFGCSFDSKDKQGSGELGNCPFLLGGSTIQLQTKLNTQFGSIIIIYYIIVTKVEPAFHDSNARIAKLKSLCKRLHNLQLFFFLWAINLLNVSAWYCTEIRLEIESNKCPSAHSFYNYFQEMFVNAVGRYFRSLLFIISNSMVTIIKLICFPPHLWTKRKLYKRTLTIQYK